ncbi:unnamed protein product [Calicophoron daubneyi]|uniref:PHD finger protein 12 n=1 Tax=Calicophoron daubneyi TaxID=300641 RepID=A0AAV2T3Q4_CALDB
MTSSDGNGSSKDSLMNEINTLFAPPTAESYGKKGLTGIPSARRTRKEKDTAPTDSSSAGLDHFVGVSSQYHSNQPNARDDPFWRKPRPNCHEFCDSCGCIEGERLVCDRCPASFHLECLDPPMDPEEAPIGVWFCQRCSMILKDEEDQTSNSSSHSTVATETGSNRSGRTGRVSGKKDDSMHPLNLLAGAALSHLQQQSSSKRNSCVPRPPNNDRALRSRSSRSAAWGESAYVADSDESDLRALWNVIKYSQYQNPKEFDLPKDLIPGVKLPGSYKTVAERKNKTIIELENGIVPRPVRRCFVCSRTCLFAPLLPCDYCSSCFHLECLDPPLPHFPPRSERWMCPNHIEHVADRYLVQTVRLTERMRIWSQLTKITGEFDGPSSQKRRKTEPTIEVKEEGDEEEGERESERSSRLAHKDMDKKDKGSDDGRPDTPPLEQVAPYELTYGPDEEAVILADLMRKVQRGREERNLIQSATVTAEALAYGADEDTIMNKSPCGRNLWRLTRKRSNFSKFFRDPSQRVKIVVPEAVKSMYAHPVKRILRPSEANSVPVRPHVEEGDSLFVRSLLQFYLCHPVKRSKDEQDIPEELKLADSPKVGAIELKDSQEEFSPDRVSDKPTEDHREGSQTAENLTSQLIGSGSSITVEKLAKTDLPLILDLARQQLRQLLEKEAYASAELHENSPASDSFLSVRKVLSIPVAPSSLRARAVLTPCGDTRGPPVKMCYRQLTVGTSPDCHLCLLNYQVPNSPRCWFSSSHHATLFYDEWTHHFELLNYSEYGSRVDGIVYGNDISTKTVYTPKPTKMVSEVRDLLRDITGEPWKKVPLSPTRRPMMIARRHEVMANLNGTCGCNSAESGHATAPNLFYQSNSTANQDPGSQISNQPSSTIAGWEGSAVLRHGSVVQFGCYKFVLGLIDFTVPDSDHNAYKCEDPKVNPVPSGVRDEDISSTKTSALLVTS